jgi:6-pyruvoyltetrahydropterin/6-carboxytetrahydropterin synthase
MTVTITAERYHDFSCGHRVHGHESKCAHLHGHNYRVTFVCQAAKLDDVGRVLDFSAIKERLCVWCEVNWDHKFLAWDQDDHMTSISVALNDRVTGKTPDTEVVMFNESIVWTPFNPTAENMARYLLDVIGPQQLAGTGVRLVKVIMEETRKCSATAKLPGAIV